MAGETLISVIMSVYNGEKYLREAIESILNQTYKNFEFIIIDDYSSDASVSIISLYNDPRIVLIQNKENLGLTKSLNIALGQAKGEFIARMDADDIALPDRLKIQLDYLEQNKDIVLIGSGTIIIDENGKEIGIKKSITDSRLLHFHMVFKNQIFHPTVLFRRKEIVGILGYDESFKFAQDYDLWSRLIDKGYNLANVGMPLLKYRLHNSSITQGKTKENSFALASSIIRRNLKKYIPFSDNQLDKYILAHNRHYIKTLSDLILVWKIWGSLEKNYPATDEMCSFIRKEKINLVRWFIKGLI